MAWWALPLLITCLITGLLAGFAIGWYRSRPERILARMPKEPPVVNRARTHRNVAIGHRAHACDLFNCRLDQLTEEMVTAAKRDLFAQAYGASRIHRQRALDENHEVPPATLPVPKRVEP